MNKEEYEDIIKYAKENIKKDILEKVVDFKQNEIDGYLVIEAYVKEGLRAVDLGEVLVIIEDYAKEKGFGVVVDFLKA